MRFTKLNTTFWTDRSSRTIAKTGPQGFQTYLYLMSCSMGNYIGIYYLNTDQACLDLGMDPAHFLKYVSAFADAGLIKYDAENEIVWVIEAAAENVGELKAGDKPDLRVKGCRKDFADVPKSSPLRAEFHAKYAEMLKLEPESFGNQAQTVAAAPAAPAAPQVNADEVKFEAVISLLSMRRAMNRGEYPAQTDSRVTADAYQIAGEVGFEDATNMVLAAIATNDLWLFEMKGHTVNATPPKASALASDDEDI